MCDTCTGVIYFCWLSQLPLKPARMTQFDANEGKLDNNCDVSGFIVCILYQIYTVFKTFVEFWCINALHLSVTTQNKDDS